MIKKLFLLICLSLYSCGYPDIDSVPDFKNVKITDEELNDLCSDKDDNQLCKE